MRSRFLGWVDVGLCDRVFWEWVDVGLCDRLNMFSWGFCVWVGRVYIYFAFSIDNIREPAPTISRRYQRRYQYPLSSSYSGCFCFTLLGILIGCPGTGVSSHASLSKSSLGGS